MTRIVVNSSSNGSTDTGPLTGFIDSILSKLRSSSNWKFSLPSVSSPNSFPASYCRGDFIGWYKRVPAAHFVVSDMAGDCWEKGFHLRGPANNPLTDAATMNIYNVFNHLFMPQIIYAHAMQRLFGNSVILLGYNDLPASEWDKPVKEGAVLKYVYALSDFDVLHWSGIPEKPTTIRTLSFSNVSSEIHKSRFVYLENTDITDTSSHGISILNCIGDALSMNSDVLWSIGQRVWRAATSLITLIGPKNLTKTQIEDVLNQWMDVNSKFVGFLPDNWKIQVSDLGKSLSDPTKDMDTIITQISIGARVPISVLKGSPQGAIGSKDRDMADYYQTISSIQSMFCSPLLLECLRLLENSKQVSLPDEFSVQWNPLHKRSFSEEAADVAGETLALELDMMLKNEQTTHEEKIALIKLLMLPGSFRR